MKEPKLKFSFATPPSTFEKEVVVTLIDQSQIKFKVTYKYRTRVEYAALRDEWFDKPNVLSTGVKTVGDIVDFDNKEIADQVLSIAEGWSLTDPFSQEVLINIHDTYPNVLPEILEVYRSAIIEGRVKN